MKSLYLTSLLLIFIFQSCQKDRNKPEEQKILLSKINYGTTTSPYVLTESYRYDSNNRLMELSITSTNPADSGLRTLYTVTKYTSNGLVAEYKSPLTSSFKLVKISYNSEWKVIKEDFFEADGITPVFGIRTISYATNKITVSRFSYPLNLLTQKREYNYSSDGKNVLEWRTMSSSGATSELFLYSDFDNKNSPTSLNPVGIFTQLTISTNNPRKIVSTTFANGGVPVTSTLSYDYNSDNYPVKRTSSSGQITTYEYIKK